MATRSHCFAANFPFTSLLAFGVVVAAAAAVVVTVILILIIVAAVNIMCAQCTVSTVGCRIHYANQHFSLYGFSSFRLFQILNFHSISPTPSLSLYCILQLIHSLYHAHVKQQFPILIFMLCFALLLSFSRFINRNCWIWKKLVQFHFNWMVKRIKSRSQRKKISQTVVYRRTVARVRVKRKNVT